MVSVICVQHNIFSHSVTGGHLLCFKAFIYLFTREAAAAAAKKKKTKKNKKKQNPKHKLLNTRAFISLD